MGLQYTYYLSWLGLMMWLTRITGVLNQWTLGKLTIGLF
jgi:hypothetical protein